MIGAPSLAQVAWRVIASVSFAPFRIGRAHPLRIAGRQRFDRLREVNLVSGVVVEEGERIHSASYRGPDAE